MNSKRDVNIDISKGIGIMLVIVGHCTIIPFDIVYRIISSFHMPLFFIWGGDYLEVNLFLKVLSLTLND